MYSNSLDKKNINSGSKLQTTLLVILVAVFLASTIYLYFYPANHLHDIKNEYPLIDPSRNFIDQEDFIVNIQPLREELNELTRSLDENIKLSLYFEVLNTGANIQINPNLAIFPASLSKLPMALMVAKKVEIGKWNWDDKLVIMSEDRDSRYGTLHGRAVGTAITIEELLKELLINSDNTAYKMFLRNTDLEDTSGLVDSMGLETLFTNEGKISAKEFTRLLRTLYTSSYLKRENSEKILDLMTQASFREYLSQGFPPEVKFAHKFGQNKGIGVFADAGIVYAGDRPYVLSVMIEVAEGKSEQEAINLMTEISKKAYQYVNSQ